MRRILTICMLVLLATTIAASAATKKKSLYKRLGGQPAIVAVVDDFVGNVAGDARINKFFATTDIAKLKKLLVEQICSASGGVVLPLSNLATRASLKSVESALNVLL